MSFDFEKVKLSAKPIKPQTVGGSFNLEKARTYSGDKETLTPPPINTKPNLLDYNFNTTTETSTQSVIQKKPPRTEPIVDVGKRIEDVSALVKGEVSVKDVVKEIPTSAKNLSLAFANTFVPAITNFFKTTGSIFGEGLAYAVDENVRKQYKAGNLDILPTISATTPADVAKDTIAAGIELAVYRSFPQIAKMKLVARGGAGALQGVGFAISEGLANDKSAEEIIKSLPLYGVGGAVIGTLTPYLMPILKAEMKQLPKEVKGIFSGLQREVTQGVKAGERKLGVFSKGAEETIPITKERTKLPAPEEKLKISTEEKLLLTERGEIGGLTKGDGFTTSSVVNKTSITQQKALNNYRKAQDLYNKKPTPENLEKVKIARDKWRDVQDLDVETPTQKPTQTISEQPTKTQPTKIIDEVIPETRTTKVSSEQLPVSGKGETRVSRLEARVRGVVDDVKTKQRAVEEGIETYGQMSKPEQIRKAILYVEKNPDEAMSVLRGEKLPPKGLLYNSIGLALEEKAALAADKNLALKLASLRSTRAGQELSILTEAKPNNPISAISDIIEARVGRVQRTLKKGETVMKNVAKETAKAKEILSKRQLKIAEAEKLLNEIVC